MPRSTGTLLDQIEVGALSSGVPLADLLRKCLALGGQAGSSELRDWARRELDGYTDGAESLPGYRTVRAPIRLDGADLAKSVRGQQLSRMQLPEFARETITEEAPVPYRVAEIERLANSDGPVHLQHPAMPDLITYMNAQAPYGTSYQSMYWAVSTASLHGILDSIRTNLVALVAELRASGVQGVPSASEATQAINVVIHGAKRSPVTINANQVSGTANTAAQGESDTENSRSQSVPAWLRGPWAVAVGGATIVAAVAGVAVWVGWSPFT